MADEGRIRVELSHLNAESTKTAEMLRDTVQSMSSMFDWLRSQDFKDSVNKLSQFNEELKRTTQRFYEEQGRATQQRGYGEGGRSEAPTAATPQAPDPGEQNRQAREERLRAENQQQADRDRMAQQSQEAQDRATAERDRMKARESMSDEQREADRRREKLGLSTLGANPTEDPKSWWNTPGGPLTDQQGFRIPRFGQLNIQDYLNMGRDLALRRMEGQAREMRAQGSSEEDIQNALQNSREGAWYGRFQRASNYAGNAFAIWHGIRRTQAFAQQQGLDPMAFADAGGALGYDRTGGQLFGVQTPFGGAGGEGWRQARDVQRMRWQAGINLQQAQAISAASAEAGFGGGLGSDLRMQFLAPAMRRWGVDPNALTPMTQVLRTGTGSIDDLNAAIAGLGTTARAAHMTVTQTAEALNAAGEAAQQMGGSYLQGVQFGNIFQQATGLPGTVGTQLAQNGIVQAFTAARTGLPAMAQGALGPVTRMRSQYDALRTMVQAFMPGAHGHTETVRDRFGHTYTETTSAQDVAIGMAAQQLGINYDQAKAMMNRAGRAGNVEVAYAATEDYARGSGERQRAMDPRSVRGRRSWVEHQIATANATQTDYNAQERYTSTTDHRWENGQLVGTDDYGKRVVVADRKLVNAWGGQWGARQGPNNLKNLQRLAKDAGVDADAIKEASQKKGRKAQAAAFRQAITEKEQEDNAAYQIAFTGEAERYFKALAKKTGITPPDPNSPSNTAAASPQGPQPTGQPISP